MLGIDGLLVWCCCAWMQFTLFRVRDEFLVGGDYLT